MPDKSFRTTITLPASLKREMDRVREPVNWSKIAAAAFQKKIAEIAEKKVKKSVQDVITRLRASKREKEVDVFRQGSQFGEKWARDEAEAIELERLEMWKARSGISWEDDFQAEVADFGPGERLYFAIQPDAKPDRQLARDFWEHVLGEPSNSFIGEFVHGFAEGALAIWSQVKAEL